MGWEALEQWGDDVARIEPLAGGVANDVWSVRVNGHLAVGRLGVRSDADLAWETALLQRLELNPESVLVIAGDELVARDARLDDTTTVEIRPVISGGEGPDA